MSIFIFLFIYLFFFSQYQDCRADLHQIFQEGGKMAIRRKKYRGVHNNNNNKNECHSNIIVDRLQGCSHSKKLRESESESRSSKVVWQARYQL